MKIQKITPLLILMFTVYTCNQAMEMEMYENKKNALFRAIFDDNRERLTALVKKMPSLLIEGKFGNYSRTWDGSPFHAAAYYNRKACLKILLEKGESPYVLDQKAHSPLHYARTVSVAQLLCPHIPVDQKDFWGTTAFMFCVKKKLFEVADFLLFYGADINETNFLKNTALHEAALNGTASAVEFLLAHNADPYLYNAQGNSAIDIAVHKDGLKSIKKVFEKYGIVFLPGVDYGHLFPKSVWFKHYDIPSINNWARLIMSTKHADTYSHIHNSMTNGIVVRKDGCLVNRIAQDDLIELFDQNFQNNGMFCGDQNLYQDIFSKVDSFLRSLCNNALKRIRENSSRSLDATINSHPFVVAYDPHLAQEMVMNALEHSDAECLAILLQKKIDCHDHIQHVYADTCNVQGNYLHQAVCADNIRALALLQEYNVNCLERDGAGLTPLEYAVQLQRKNCIAQLNSFMCKQFVQELQKGNYKKCKQFLLQITDCNILVEEKQTLLHFLVHEKNVRKRNQYLMLLKDKKVDLNKICNNINETPLQEAFSLQNKKDFCVILLEAGAHPDVVYNGNPLLWSVIQHGDMELLELCLKKGAFVKETWLKWCVENRPDWEGTVLLQTAYEYQQQILLAICSQ